MFGDLFFGKSAVLHTGARNTIEKGFKNEKDLDRSEDQEAKGVLLKKNKKIKKQKHKKKTKKQKKKTHEWELILLILKNKQWRGLPLVWYIGGAHCVLTALACGAPCA